MFHKILNTNIILIFFLFFAKILVVAQNYSCEGKVTDKNTGEPLPFVTVLFIELPDSTFYAGAITNEEGNFLIQNLTHGNYLCRIHYIGYQQKDTIFLIQEKRKVNLGRIELMPNTILLQQISITAQLPNSVKIDRTVYQVDSTLLSKVTTSVELLAKIPELFVNKANETVNIKGKEKGKTVVMLNGVLTSVGADIGSIDPQDIARIEVITAPSSEYSTDIDGVVNIILKEKIDQGYGFRIYGGWDAPPYNRIVGGLKFNYGTEKVRYTFSCSNIFYDHKRESDTIYREIYSSEEPPIIYQSNEKFAKYTNILPNVENRIEYYINNSNFLALYTNNKIQLLSTKSQSYSTQTDFHNFSDTVSSLCENDVRSFIGNYTLFYRKKFKKEDHNFTANFNFYHLYATNISKYNESKMTDSLPLSDYSRKENTKSSRYSYNLKIDYYNPISKKFNFNTGALAYYQILNTNYQDGGFSDTIYNYSILKSHYYADLLFHHKNFSLRIGNKIEGYLAFLNDISCVNKFYYLPSLTVLQTIKDEHTLRFNYRAVNYYPSVWMLNSYRTYSSDSLSAREGNPSLKPATLHTFSLEYYWMRDIFSLQTLFSYQYLQNFMFEQKFYQQNVFVSKPINMKGINKFVFFLNTSFELDFAYFSLDVSPFYEYITNNIINRKNFNFDLNLSAEFYLPYDFEIDLYLEYYGKRINYDGYLKNSPMLEFYISKKFFKNRLSISMGYTGWFTPNHVIIENKQLDLYQWQKHIDHYRGFVIDITYFFRKGKVYKTENIEQFIESDIKKETK